MKISTKGRYGIRAVVDIAKNSEKEAVSLSSIAKRQNISESYLEQIVIPLKKAEYIEGIRGPKGGYVLSKPADKITVKDLLVALEGDIAITNCSSEFFTCDNSGSCNTEFVWTAVTDAVDNVLKSITVKDIIDNN